MPDEYTVIGVNYHRIGEVDPHNPFHRLHTVSSDVFCRQLDHMQQLGNVVSLEDVRACRNLAEVNFVVSFDDVPLAAWEGIQLALQRQLPVTVSVCGTLAAHGWGVRDLVYCIEKYADPQTIARWVYAHLPPEAVGDEPVSFYHLTKRDDLDPDLVLANLIDPLFAQIEAQARPFLDAGGYMSWETIGQRLARHPLVTLASHGWSHTNLVAASRARLQADITHAHHAFEARLGLPPRYFTVPFGRYEPQLAVDCINLLHGRGYHGILWVGKVATIIRGAYHHQLLQLTRLHTSTTLDGFVDQVDHLRRNRLDAAVWQTPPRTHRRPVTVVESSDSQRSVRHEMIVRQGKDYASDPAYYHYQFTDNPYKGGRPDFYAVECDGRIEAAAYNLHTAFRVGDVTVPGVYLSSWRKLPEAHLTAAATLVQRMASREAVVGVYHPSPAATPAFCTWHQVPTWQLTLATDSPAANEQLAAPYRVIELDHFDHPVAALCEALMAEAGFTVVRDRTYHRWRHETYPLASCRYLLLLHDERPVGYAVALRCRNRISIADWYATRTDAYPALAAAALRHGFTTGATVAEFETSNLAIADEITEWFGATRVRRDNFYHLNPARLAEHGITPGQLRWDQFRLHETGTTSDVLIR